MLSNLSYINASKTNRKKYPIASDRTTNSYKKRSYNMTMFEKLFALFLLAIIPNSIAQVDATFSKSMYITWGAQHASLQNDDLQLVLDKTSGNLNGI